MSDLSEELHEAIMNYVGAVNGREPKIINAANEAEDAALRGVGMVKETCDYHDNEITKCIRRAYRKFAGSAPFETPVDARTRTEPVLLPTLVGTALNALADGIQMGRKDSKVYKKYKTLRKLDKVLVASGFREASDVLVMRYQADPDCQDVIKGYIESCFHHMGMATGYGADPDSPIRPHSVDKIWDLWSLVMRSVIIGLFLTGYHFGEAQIVEEKRLEEERILEGILSASTGTDDG